MLKNLSSLRTPDLLHTLASIGRGDELAIVDTHFPAVSMTQRLVWFEGVGAPAATVRLRFDKKGCGAEFLAS